MNADRKKKSDSYLLRDCMVKSCLGIKRFDIMCPLQVSKVNSQFKYGNVTVEDVGWEYQPFVCVLTDLKGKR